MPALQIDLNAVVGDVTTKHAGDRHGAVDADYQAWLAACYAGRDGHGRRRCSGTAGRGNVGLMTYDQLISDIVERLKPLARPSW